MLINSEYPFCCCSFIRVAILLFSIFFFFKQKTAYEIPVLVIFTLSRTELPRRLRILQLQLHVTRAGSLEEIQNILRIEADGKRLAVIVNLKGVFGLASLGGGSGKLQFAFLQAYPDGA